MGGGSKPATSTQNSVQKNDPWAPAAPALQDMIQRATVAYDQTPKTGTYVGPNADMTAGIDSLRAAAPGLATGVDATRTLATDMLAGKYLDPATNPYLAGAVTAAQKPLRDQLDQNILSIGDAAQMAGAYGGSRQQLVNATALGDFNEAALNSASNIYADNYARERQLQLAAPDLLSVANQLSLQPGQLLGSIGDQQREWETQQRADAIDAPWTGLDRLSQILGTVTPYGTSTTDSTTTATPAKGSKASGALSGALGGASAGSSFGPWGAGIGAVIGGLGGLFG